jgi:hypothetical protein
MGVDCAGKLNCTADARAVEPLQEADAQLQVHYVACGGQQRASHTNENLSKVATTAVVQVEAEWGMRRTMQRGSTARTKRTTTQHAADSRSKGQDGSERQKATGRTQDDERVLSCRTKVRALFRLLLSTLETCVRVCACAGYDLRACAAAEGRNLEA